ncbi:MAG: DUF748 domain-containing protein [Rhodocyclales bacterium]|nr:DUF748 domain-containing protein [Rhodocyclales bacterium]
MTPLHPRIRRAALVAAGILVFLLGFAWLALPGILQSQAQRIVAEKSGHTLSLAKPEINPLALSLRLRELKLVDPEGAPLLAFRELFVDLSIASLTSRSVVIEELKLDGLAASVILRDGAQGPLNWSRLLAAFAGKDEKKADAPPPRIEIRHLALTGAQADIADRRSSPPFVGRVEAFDLDLSDISTRAEDSGPFRITARTSFGAQLEWSGEATLNPAGSRGHLDLRGVDLGKLGPLLAARMPPELGFAPPEGVASLALDYRLAIADGKLAFVLEPFTVDVAKLALRKPKAAGAPAIGVGALALGGGRFDLATQQLAFQSLTLRDASLESGAGKQRTALFALPELTLAPSRIDLAQRSAELGAVQLSNGRLALRRDAGGAIDLLATLKALAPDAPAAKPAPVAAPPGAPPAPWRYAVERIALSGFGIAFDDESMAPPLRVGLDEVSIETSGVSEKLERALPLRIGLRVASGGRLAVDGKLVPATMAVDLQLKLDDLALAPAQPFIGKYAALDLAGGRISAAGKVQHDAKASGYKGSLAIDALRLNEAGTDKVFLAWKQLGTKQLDVTPQKLQIGELLLDGLDTQLLIAKDKSTNFKRILRQRDAPAAAPGDAPAPPAVAPATEGSPIGAPTSAPAPAADAKKAPAFLVNIDRLRLRNGELDFADESLFFPFATRIHKLRGSIAGLSSRPGAAGQLELDGEVDDYGLARAVGQIDPFDPTGFTEIRLIFRNLEMTHLTPYSATFAGRRIDSGKLSLDLEYNIRKRQLQSENKVVIDKLVLGERVDSPSAKDLPLDLAIALLEDSDGRIDLGLPITGSLDDPQFSYGALVWKVIGNVLTKIVTAPFRALGALFGGGDEKLDSIAFEAGARRLTPPEREKLVKLAAALNKRPALALSISGTWNAADRVALQDLQLRRALLEKSGQKVDAQGDPGPISTRSPAIQAALETLFGDRFGAAELAGLKQGFREANPGQLEESMTGKMMSRLTGLVRPPRELNESEVGALKGADFHAVLYQRLREKEAVADERLQQLAQARGEATLAVLKEAKAPVERVTVGAVEKIAGEDHEVPLKLGLGKAAR